MSRKKKIRLQDIAEKTGFSISTISHYINRTRNIDVKTSEIIATALKEMKYQVPSSRNHLDTDIKSIGVIIADIRVDFFAEMIRELEDIAYEYGFHIIVMDSEENPEKELYCLKTLIHHSKVSGILLSPVRTTTDYSVYESFPIVQFDRLLDHSSMEFVGIDNMRVSYNLVKQLIDRGLQKIGIISFSNRNYCSRERVHGYQLAMMEKNLFNPAYTLTTDFDAGDSHSSIGEFIDAHRDLESIFCTSTNICYETLAKIKEMHEQGIPTSLKHVCTFDNNRWLDYIDFPVDSVSQPITDIANNSIAILKERIQQGKTEGTPRHLYLNCTLECRSSYFKGLKQLSL
jgi:DNA-binding LacI/PurR family transcriptional regulator